MESFYVLYQILPPSSSYESSSSSFYSPCLSSLCDSNYNCYEYETPLPKQDILLLDILTSWSTHLPNFPLSYNFFTTSSNPVNNPRNNSSSVTLIHLPSLASCLPVIDGNIIYLFLQPSGSSLPFSPFEQFLAFYDKSQRELYGTSTSVNNAIGPSSSSASRRKGNRKGNNDDRATMSTTNTTSFNNQQSQSQSGTPPTSSSSQQQQQQQQESKSTSKRSKQVETTEKSSNRDDNDERYTEKSASTRERPPRYEKTTPTPTIDLASLTEAAEAASQAGMEAAGVAARSFLSFAANTLMTVVNTSMSFTAGNILQIGEHRVTFIRDLAEGGFGKVSLVKDCSQPSPTIPVSSIGRYYAMKTLLCQSKEQLAEGINELKMLVMFRGHPNIVELIDSSNVAVGKKNSNIRQLSFLFPLYHMGTCWDLISTATTTHNTENQLNAATFTTWCFTEKQVLEILLGTSRALESIHENNLIHFDMKPHNILLTDDMQPVVMDLGSMGPYRQIRNRRDALNLEEEAAIKCSAPYRAPELTQVPTSCDIGGWCDVWSLGCTMFALAFGHSPFESPKEGVLRLAILNGKYSTPPGNSNMGVTFSASFISLMDAMLQVDYTLRPAAEEVKERIKEILDEDGGY